MSLQTSMLIPLLAWLAAAPAADTVPAARPSDAPAAVLVHRQSSLPIVAIRLSLLADDPPGYAGVGHLIQHLHEPMLEQRMQRLGGRASIERNADALVYTVTGAVEDLDELVAALRAVLEPPVVSEGELSIARQALASERLAEWETAAGHARAVLRGRLFPADLPAAGTTSSATRWQRTMLADAWAAMYRPERVSIVAVGDVSVPVVERAFADLPEPRGARPLRAFRDSVPAAALASAQATQGWIAHGHAVDTDPAVVSVVARLLQDHLRAHLPTARVTGEHWWTHHGQAIVLVVAAPEPALAGARRALGTAVAALQAELDDDRVRAAAAALRREMLFYSRTPPQMAELIGRFNDRAGEPDAAQRYYEDLARVDARQVRRLLADQLARTPSRVEIPPQRLPRPS
jgi:predicted Zn-dependent peptidase